MSRSSSQACSQSAKYLCGSWQEDSATPDLCFGGIETSWPALVMLHCFCCRVCADMMQHVLHTWLTLYKIGTNAPLNQVHTLKIYITACNQIHDSILLLSSAVPINSTRHNFQINGQFPSPNSSNQSGPSPAQALAVATVPQSLRHSPQPHTAQVEGEWAAVTQQQLPGLPTLIALVSMTLALTTFISPCR